MSEEAESEKKELRETIEELQEERREGEQEQRQTAWTRYIALTTAILAVFAAIGALQSGSLINESMMDQLRASDQWNEYQAARQKEHLYTLEANKLLDRGAALPPLAAQKDQNALEAGVPGKSKVAQKGAGRGAPDNAAGRQSADRTAWKAVPPAARL